MGDSSSSTPLHVVIVGAGLAGLAIAHGLEKHSIPYTLVDRETQTRDRNWGVTLSWSSPLLTKLLPESLTRTLQSIQPDPTLNNAASGLEHIIIRCGATGSPLTQPSFPGVRRVNIGKMKAAWSQSLPLKLGKKLVSISAGPVAHFADGTAEPGTVLIGCDGGASAVRRSLLSAEDARQEVLPYVFLNFATTYMAEQARWLDREMNPNVDVATHPKGMYMGLLLLDKPEIEKPETWIYYLLVTWPISKQVGEVEDSSAARLQSLRARMDGWADPYKSAVAWLRDDTVIPRDELRIWHPKRWDNRGGTVTLAGDAAHSMTFHRGQGGNLAIKDADEFVGAMARVQRGELGLKEAVDAYDEGVLARGEEVETSKVQTDAFHDYDNFMQSPVFKQGIRPAAVVAGK